MEQVLFLLFEWPLLPESGLDSNEIMERFEEALTVIRSAIKAPYFDVHHPKGKENETWQAGSKLKRFKLLISRAKAIVRACVLVDDGAPLLARVLVEDGTPATGGEQQGESEALLVRVARILVGAGSPKCAAVLEFAEGYTKSMIFINSWKWEKDDNVGKTLEDFQRGVDRWADLMIDSIWGDRAITTYFHDLIAAHMYEQMLVYGPLARWCNEAVERRNMELKNRYHFHTQRGGSRRKQEGGKKLGSIGDWCGRAALRNFEQADSILDAAVAARLETRRAARRARGLPPDDDEDEADDEDDDDDEDLIDLCEDEDNDE
jgi:hypothetical protein